MGWGKRPISPIPLPTSPLKRDESCAIAGRVCRLLDPHKSRMHHLAMTPVERFLIGVQMFDTARTMALASFPDGLSPEQIRRRLCERLYGTLAREVFGERS